MSRFPEWPYMMDSAYLLRLTESGFGDNESPLAVGQL